MSNQGTLSKHSSGNDDIDKEVAKILRSQGTSREKDTYQILDDLKRKYKDSQIVDSILERYKNKLNRVRKLAEKIKEKLVTKYPNFTTKEYITKITEYQKKYKFDDNEMDAILRLLFRTGQAIISSDAYDEYNAMSKALGFRPLSYHMRDELQVAPDQMDALQDILKVNAATSELHYQVQLQSLVYDDKALVGVSGDFDKLKSGFNMFNYIHPVIVALFLPKINFVDEHMLIASISGVVKSRYERTDIETQPDYELYIDIASDPAETSCTAGSRTVKPFTDLLARCDVQTKIWEAVLNLRQGKYYSSDLNTFAVAIDACKNNIFDAADLAYVKDEGTVLRKLLGVFSMRPTIVATAPIYGINTITAPIASVAATHVTTVPMISLRINIYDKNSNQAVRLTEALEQRQYYIHKRQITVKSQEILYSREILAFYVHRRYQNINLARLTRPYELSVLPITMNQFEKLNTTQVVSPLTIDIRQQKFVLKSVVAVETVLTKYNHELITGCSALVRKNVENVGEGAFYYNPLDLRTDAPRDKINPLKWIPVASGFVGEPSLLGIAEQRGTLFIYKCENLARREDYFYDF